MAEGSKNLSCVTKLRCLQVGWWFFVWFWVLWNSLNWCKFLTIMISFFEIFWLEEKRQGFERTRTGRTTNGFKCLTVLWKSKEREEDAENTIISRIRTSWGDSREQWESTTFNPFPPYLPSLAKDITVPIRVLTFFFFPRFEWTNNKYFRKDFLNGRIENVQFPYSPILTL